MANTTGSQMVDIPDRSLRNSIEEALGKESGGPITEAEMATLTQFSALSASISDLTGLEFATNLTSMNLEANAISDLSVLSCLINLTTLKLSDNSISDLSALCGLTNLKLLTLYKNSVSDISALSGLTNLTVLNLMENSISDISALSRLTNLTVLNLGENSISDISALLGLTNLTLLWLEKNSISDISALSRLTNLTSLYLEKNSISDISTLSGLCSLTWLCLEANSVSDLLPLLTNTGLGKESMVYLEGNRLSYPSIYTYIPALQSRGVKVHFNDRTPTRLLKILGDNQHGPPGVALAYPFVVEVKDQNSIAFEEVPVSFTVNAGSGMLSVQNAETDSNGRAESTLTLGPDAGMNTVNVTGVKIWQTQTFIATTVPPIVNPPTWIHKFLVKLNIKVKSSPVDIPDCHLREDIERALRKGLGELITREEMLTLTQLFAKNHFISDLTGLQFATNLTDLSLRDSSISDISALKGLTNLRSLYLQSNSLSDISALSHLTNLRGMTLASPLVLLGISALSRLTNLETLHLWVNSVSDISALSHLTNLRRLTLGNTRLIDLSALSGLTNLEWLRLEQNSVSDISALLELTNLTELNLERNSPSYQSINTHIPALRGRGVMVRFSDRIPTLLKVSGDNPPQQGLSGTTLPQPFIVKVEDQNNTVFEGVPVTFTVTAGGGMLSVENAVTDAYGKAESTLTLGNTLPLDTDPWINTVEVTIAETDQTQTFTANGFNK